MSVFLSDSRYLEEENELAIGHHLLGEKRFSSWKLAEINQTASIENFGKYFDKNQDCMLMCPVIISQLRKDARKIYADSFFDSKIATVVLSASYAPKD